MDIVKTAGFLAASPYSRRLSDDATSNLEPAAVGQSPTQSYQAAQAVDTKTRSEEGGDVEGALSKLKEKLQDERRNLDFSVDDSTGEVVVKVLDGESGKLIRQIPSEEVLKLAKQLDDFRSLLFKAKA